MSSLNILTSLGTLYVGFYKVSREYPLIKYN